MNEMTTSPLAEIRAAHMLCTHSRIQSGGIKINKAGCSCGAYYTWQRREDEHGLHVDTVIAEHFAAREAAARREALLEAAFIRAEAEQCLMSLRAMVARVEALADDLTASLDPSQALPPMRTREFVRKVESELRAVLAEPVEDRAAMAISAEGEHPLPPEWADALDSVEAERALAEPERDEEPSDPGVESTGIVVPDTATGRAMWKCSTCGTRAYGFSSMEAAKRDLGEHVCPTTERDEEGGR